MSLTQASLVVGLNNITLNNLASTYTTVVLALAERELANILSGSLWIQLTEQGNHQRASRRVGHQSRAGCIPAQDRTKAPHRRIGP